MDVFCAIHDCSLGFSLVTSYSGVMNTGAMHPAVFPVYPSVFAERFHYPRQSHMWRYVPTNRFVMPRKAKAACCYKWHRALNCSYAGLFPDVAFAYLSAKVGMPLPLALVRPIPSCSTLPTSYTHNMPTWSHFCSKLVSSGAF